MKQIISIKEIYGQIQSMMNLKGWTIRVFVLKRLNWLKVIENRFRVLMDTSVWHPAAENNKQVFEEMIRKFQTETKTNSASLQVALKSF